MGRSGGGSFGGGGFGGGFSSGGGGFGGSFGGGNRIGGRSSGAPTGGFGHGGGGGGFGGGSFWGGLWLGSLLGGSRGRTVVVQQPQGGSGGGPGAPGPSGSPSSSGSGGKGCLWALIAIVAVIIIASLFGVFGGGSMAGIPDSTVERTALPAGTAEVTPYYTDEDGDWVHNPATLEAGLRHFYEETGVWPYVYILPNGTTRSSSQLSAMAQQLYGELFTDDAHFILVFCDNDQGGYNCGYYGGQAARSVLDDEAVQILAAYLERNYDDRSLSEEQIFSNTFSQTADHIMSKTLNPAIPIAIVIGVIAVAVIVAVLVKRGREAKKREADRMERILNTPLEQFGDKDLEDLAQKYEGAPAAGAGEGGSAPSAEAPAASTAPAGAANEVVNTATADGQAERPE